MDKQSIVDLRYRVLAGEEVSDEELADAIEFLAERALPRAAGKAANRKQAVDLTEGGSNADAKSTG